MELSEIRKNDYERYFCALFAKDKRDDLFRLYAFNNEIAKIYDVVSEPMLGHIRLTWWREATQEIYSDGKTREHEVVDALAELVNNHPNLKKEDFLKLIEAREKDFDENSFETVKELEEYCASTSAKLLEMVADILEVDRAPAKDIGIAWAILGILRSSYINIPKGRIQLPKDLMEKHKVNLDRFGGKEFLENSKKLVEELVELAEKHLKEARKNAKEIKKSLPILLLTTLAENHIKNIKNAEFDVFSKNTEKENYIPLLSMIKIYSYSIVGKF